MHKMYMKYIFLEPHVLVLKIEDLFKFLKLRYS